VTFTFDTLTASLSLARLALTQAYTLAVDEQTSRVAAVDAALAGTDEAALQLAVIRRDQASGLIRSITRAQDAVDRLV
jgi:hypothetical protein